MREAIFGGTFDPIHNAHTTIARAAADRFALDRVLFVPASNPPHKPGHTAAPYEDRYAMVVLACHADERFAASRLEAGADKSYSIHTIERVRTALPPDSALFFIIGSDAFAEIRTWYRWQEVAASVEFIVVTRPGHSYDVPPGARVHELPGLDLPVSSSEIRRELRDGIMPAELPEPVAAYIAAHRLYGYCTR